MSCTDEVSKVSEVEVSKGRITWRHGQVPTRVMLGLGLYRLISSLFPFTFTVILRYTVTCLACRTMLPLLLRMKWRIIPRRDRCPNPMVLKEKV